MDISVGTVELVLAQTALVRAGDTAGLPKEGTFGAPPNRRQFKRLALDFLADLLQLPAVEYSARESDMRLRVALHFACPEAVDYRSERSEPRWQLIFNHLQRNFDFSVKEGEQLSRLVAIVLDNWDRGRLRGLHSRRAKLLERQGYKCNCCRLNFSDQARVQREEEAAVNGSDDPYKPYFDGSGVDLAMGPQVDHINVVSKDGTNEADNLQVLCGLCNQGKGDNGGIRPTKELELCHLPITQIPRGHRMSLLYYRIQMDRGVCTVCESSSNELTVRLVRDGGVVALTNLKTICYSCVKD